MAKAKKKAVVIFTDKKGVFMGLVALKDLDDLSRVTLDDAQMCVYWSSDIGGVLGLAARGPSKSCRVSPVVKSLTAIDVHSFAECTDDAVRAWRDQPWG